MTKKKNKPANTKEVPATQYDEFQKFMEEGNQGSETTESLFEQADTVLDDTNMSKEGILSMINKEFETGKIRKHKNGTQSLILSQNLSTIIKRFKGGVTK